MRYFTLVLSLPCLLLCAQEPKIEKLAPYYPTPTIVVEKMLELGGLKPGEKMFDLGSGDGRIVIIAAQKYKARATGVEFDVSLVKQSIGTDQDAGPGLHRQYHRGRSSTAGLLFRRSIDRLSAAGGQ